MSKTQTKIRIGVLAERHTREKSRWSRNENEWALVSGV